MNITDCHRLAKSEVVDIDHETLGDSSVDSFDFEFLHRKAEFTTGFYTFSMTVKLNRYFNSDGFLVVYFEKVDMENCVLDRLELDVFQHSHTFFAVDIELDSIDVGSIDEFADSVVSYGEICSDKTLVIADFNDFFTGLECTFEGEFDDFAAISTTGILPSARSALVAFFPRSVRGSAASWNVFICLLFNVLLKIKFDCSLISHHTGC